MIMKALALSLLFAACTFAFGPTKYKIQIMDSTGVVEEYVTSGCLAETNAYVLDVLVQTVMLVPAIFIPNGYVESNEGIISTGIGFRSFFKTFLSPVRSLFDALLPLRLGNNTQSSKWITFTDDKGRQVTITGKEFVIQEIRGLRRL